MRDQLNHLHFVPAVAPVAARTDNAAILSAIIDRLGYESLTFAIVTGTNTDVNATFAVLVEDGDNSGLSDNAAVADDFLVGTEALAGFTFADDVECRKVGYIGAKRYVRLTITPTGNDSGNIFLAAIAVLGRPHSMPTANPPQ
jgi:hypothetical protein